MMQQFEPFSSVVSSSANDEPFMVEQSRYETLIADPVYEDLWHLTQRLRASRLAAPDYSAVGAINSKIDALIGNARLRAPIEARGEAYFIHDLSALDATEVEARKREFLNAVDAEDEFFPQALDGTDHFTISPCDADGRSNPAPMVQVGSRMPRETDDTCTGGSGRWIMGVSHLHRDSVTSRHSGP
jgi:hypothetical protein